MLTTKKNTLPSFHTGGKFWPILLTMIFPDSTIGPGTQPVLNKYLLTFQCDGVILD